MIISIFNPKGGVGKTTTTVNLGAGLNQLHKKVLLVDLDPQANLTYSLGVEARDLDLTIYDMLHKKADARDIIIDRGGLHILPSNNKLIRVEKTLSGTNLLNELKTLRYDYILIDCPPSVRLLSENALKVADKIFIPLQVEFLALHGLRSLLDMIDKNKIGFVIPQRFHGGKNINKDSLEILKKHFADKLPKTVIRENVSLAEAPSYGLTIFEYDKNSRGAKDYLKLSKEVTQKKLL